LVIKEDSFLEYKKSLILIFMYSVEIAQNNLYRTVTSIFYRQKCPKIGTFSRKNKKIF